MKHLGSIYVFIHAKMQGHKLLYLLPYAVLSARILFNTYSFYVTSSILLKIHHGFFLYFLEGFTMFFALNMVELKEQTRFKMLLP